ncbi:antibiotic ABC transporter permease [Haloferax volcanii]|uniref:antibiotic ABC transporter permease n=1 Tax=Haloferax volcanii TaxID=2246 RepID=UPI00349F70A4
MPKLFTIVEDVLDYSRDRDYIGYDKADGLSSRILQSVPIDNKWINVFFQESCKRAPINIRPFLLVTKKRNTKGGSLFAIANKNMYDVSGKLRYKDEYYRLLDWLVSADIDGYSGYCVGHRHPIQTLSEKTEANTPDIVSTSFAVKALCQSNNDEYVNTAESAANFLTNELNYEELETGARIKYKPTSPDQFHTLNANALGARMLADIYAATGEDKYLNKSHSILKYVASKQQPCGGWMYREPASASHVSMDNYHNGFIVESLIRYSDVAQSNEFIETIDNGLQFYRSLFSDAGAPSWDEDNTYPRDIHAAAEGIIVFNLAGKSKFAKQISKWAIENLYSPEGRFYYQKMRFYTKRFTLMRWCQGWMSYALSSPQLH